MIAQEPGPHSGYRLRCKSKQGNSTFVLYDASRAGFLLGAIAGKWGAGLTDNWWRQANVAVFILPSR